MKDGEDGSQSSGPVLEHKKKIDDIKISFLGEISHGPNDPVPEQVRPLLDYIQEVRSSWPDDVETMLFHDSSGPCPILHKFLTNGKGKISSFDRDLPLDDVHHFGRY